MYKEEYYDYSGKEGKWIKDELKKRGVHHVTISNFPADFFRMSKSQLEKLFEKASNACMIKHEVIPATKHMCTMMGFPAGEETYPLRRIQETGRAELEQDLIASGWPFKKI